MLDLLSTSQLIFAFVIILVAFIIRGITGFGSGLIAIPLIALMLPISVVVPMVGLLDYLAALGHGLKLRSDIVWKQILNLLPFTIIGVLLALYLFNTVDPGLLKKFLGGFIILYALYTLFSLRPHRHSSFFWAVPGGVIGGLISTLFGTGGPFYVIYLQLQGLGKTTFRATIATIFFLDGTARIVAYSFNGFYTMDVLLLITICFPVMMVGMYIGGHIHTNISYQSIQKAIAVLLLVSGGALLWS